MKIEHFSQKGDLNQWTLGYVQESNKTFYSE